MAPYMADCTGMFSGRVSQPEKYDIERADCAVYVQDSLYFRMLWKHVAKQWILND